MNSLICLGKLLDFLEKWVVLDDILPILEKITVRDSGVLMAMLGIYKVALTHPKLGITKDILATRVLPSITPILIDGNLNMKQFDAYMKVTKEMLAQIETEQKRKLDQIEALEREKRLETISHKFYLKNLSNSTRIIFIKVLFRTPWQIRIHQNRLKFTKDPKLWLIFSNQIFNLIVNLIISN